MHEWNTGEESAGQQYNRLLNAVVTTMDYKKITIDHVLYINLLSGGTVYCITVSNDDVLNTTNNQIPFTELIIFLRKFLRIKSKKYIYLSIGHLKIRAVC